MAAAVVCLSPGCPHVARSRGLCDTHYGQVRERVRRGETPWEQLEREGRCLPAKPHPWRRRKEQRR
jgi:hypothetical protein